MPSGRYSREPITLSFPPFTPAVAWLVGINVGVYFLLLLLQLAPSTRGVAAAFVALGALTPSAVTHGFIWQLVSYDFIQTGLLQLIIFMLMLWMFGAQLEQAWGRRRFFALYFTSVIGAALVTIAVAYTGALRLTPDMQIAGAASGLYGIYIAFGTVFAESELMMFPLPISIKAKYFIWILIVITLATSLSQGSGAVTELGGLLFGYVFVKMAQRRPLRAYSGGSAYRGGRGYSAAAPPTAKRAPLVARWKDGYYRWKRRRAARKFEVYMRKHNRNVMFDEHGNYIPPDDGPRSRGDNGGEGKGGWIN